MPRPWMTCGAPTPGMLSADSSAGGHACDAAGLLAADGCCCPSRLCVSRMDCSESYHNS